MVDSRIMGKITKSLPLGILGLVLFAYIGSKFPDIDQRTDVLTHRSILTHGLIVPVVFYLLSFKLKNSLIRSFVIVFLTGVAIHLCFDLFPKGWYMHALIHIPSIGWTPALVSKIWMFVSVVFCCYGAIKLIRSGSQGILLVFATVSIFVFQSFGESTFIGPLAILIVADAIAIWWKLTEHSLKVRIFKTAVKIVFLNISTLCNSFANIYRIARDEYNSSTEQKRSFPRFLFRVWWLWLLLFFTTIRDVFKNCLNYAYKQFKKS